MDGLQGELSKYGGKGVHEEILTYRSKYWGAAEVQTQWKGPKIVAIYKRKGDKAEC